VPWHAPPEQASLTVQKSPSSHGAVLFGCVQTPAPLQTSLVHRLPSLAQALPDASNWQVDEQQSPSTLLPSSHCSPGSRMPLPHGMPPGQKPDG
jgi:hypothetical protein